MVSAEILATLSLAAFVAAGVLLGITVFLWFYFKIPSVYDDLSGRTARRSIAKMRGANEASGVKSYHMSRVNAERGKVTGVMGEKKKKDDKKVKKTKKASEARVEKTEPMAAPAGSNDRPDTGLLVENRADTPACEATSLLQEQPGTGSEPTSLLQEQPETGSEPTGLLREQPETDSEPTGLLVEEEGTTLLQPEEATAGAAQRGGMQMRLLEKVMLIHTEETIDI